MFGGKVARTSSLFRGKIKPLCSSNMFQRLFVSIRKILVSKEKNILSLTLKASQKCLFLSLELTRLELELTL